MRKSTWLCIATSFWLAVITTHTFAAEPSPPRYNSVDLQADAQREVPNDLLNATLYVELDDANPAAVANAVNKRINEALRIAKEYKTVRARSGNNQTTPVYSGSTASSPSKGNVLQGWRGRGEIRLDSTDFEAASGLIGKLQASMQLAGISFSVSPDTRRAMENELITEAITAFKARAEIIRNALAGRGYKLQRLNISSGYNVPQPRYAAPVAMTAEARSVAAPGLQGGVSQITVHANGAIEIVE